MSTATEAVTGRPKKRYAKKRKKKKKNVPVRNSSDMFHKMLHKRLFLVVTAVNIVSFSEEKAIQDWNFKFDIVNGASKTSNQLVNEDSNYKDNRISGINNDPVDHENCTDKNCSVKGKENDRSCPYESKELCLIFSLSKIAKIQIASLSEVAAGRSIETGTRSDQNSNVAERTKGIYLDRPKLGENENLQRSSSSSVQCRAVRDVYIPEVKQHLPAFACQFGNNTFILSSARFLQDRRSRLEINVNEDTFKSIKSTPKLSRSNQFNVIPALLVLNTANNDYRIEMQGNISNDQRKEGN